ncbi:MAG: hypothetical protein AAB528_06715 [Chloroflexota bacterium]
MALENRGVPTVVVCTKPFLDSALVHARTFGRPNFQPVVIPHPLGGLGPALVRERAASILDIITGALTAPD